MTCRQCRPERERVVQKAKAMQAPSETFVGQIAGQKGCQAAGLRDTPRNLVHNWIGNGLGGKGLGVPCCTANNWGLWYAGGIRNEAGVLWARGGRGSYA